MIQLNQNISSTGVPSIIDMQKEKAEIETDKDTILMNLTSYVSHMVLWAQGAYATQGYYGHRK